MDANVVAVDTVGFPAATLFAAVAVAVAWWSRARATEQRPAIL